MRIWLRFILPTMCGMAILVIMLELYYGTVPSIVVALVCGCAASADGRARSQRLRTVESLTEATGVMGRISFMYAGALAAAVAANVISTRYQILFPYLAAPLAGMCVYSVGGALLMGDWTPSFTFFRRGRKLNNYRMACRRAARLRRNGDPGIYWGGLLLPSSAAVRHFCVAGATGSGKTTVLRLLMQSVLPAVGRQKDARALVYDAKREIISLLHGMGLACEVRILNPFDSRSWAWDIARDVTSPSTAAQIASILIPPEEGSNQFFSNAAQHLLAGVMVSFICSKRLWTLRDVLFATGDPTRLRAVLEREPYTKGLIAKYFLDERLLHNILSTLASKTMLYEPVAAVWDRAASAGRILSLQDWAAESYILVLGNDEQRRVPIDAINRFLFQRASELLLDAPGSESRRSWMFLDEVGKAGKLNGLDNLLTKGRSNGVCVVLGLQDIDSLRDPAVYGEKAANVILGQCEHTAILHLNSPETARWASALIGEFESREYHTSESSGGGQSVSEQVTKREAVLPAEILSLPLPSHRGVAGYYVSSPPIGVYVAQLNLLPLLRQPADIPNYVRRDGQEEYLVPWSAADMERLGFSCGETDADAPEPEPAPRERPLAIPLEHIPRMTLDGLDSQTL